MSSSSTKVIIIGCGIAGPVLAIFLKMKGYEPVVYERLVQSEDAGLSLCLQPNGLRVLGLIPGLVEKIEGRELDKMFMCSIVDGDEGVLVDSDLPSTFREAYGYKMTGVRRPALLRLLVQTATEYGIAIIWGHQLESLKQAEDSVTVKFQNGSSDTASFVVGCDGLHSNTRACLFGREKAVFTGVVQTGGISPRPASFPHDAAFANFYGNGQHMVAYTVSPTQVSWAISQQEPESKETWRYMDDPNAQQAFRDGPFSQMGLGAGDLVKTAQKIVKYGLWDRPELTTWHSGRAVLLGDAAHPTSPHLGQGANLCFEDIYHLIRLLKTHNPSGRSPSTAVLSDIFTQYEQVRIPRTSALVQGARKVGESRTLQGLEACRARNAEVRENWSNPAALAAVAAQYDSVFSAPFTGTSEI